MTEKATSKDIDMVACGLCKDAQFIRANYTKLNTFHKQLLQEAMADINAALTMSRPYDDKNVMGEI